MATDAMKLLGRKVLEIRLVATKNNTHLRFSSPRTRSFAVDFCHAFADALTFVLDSSLLPSLLNRRRRGVLSRSSSVCAQVIWKDSRRPGEGLVSRRGTHVLASVRASQV